jgi:hypothetical protein
MAKRMSIVVVAVLALLFASAPARAQGNSNPQPIFTYVSQWGVPRAHWADMAKTNADSKALLDPFVADGTLVGYGFYENRVHSDGGYTHGSWIQANSLANLFKALEPLYARPDTTGTVFAASKHMDYLMISTSYGGGAVTDATGYLHVISVQIQPNKMDDFMEAYHRYLAPVYDKLVADGSIISYQLDTEYNVENAPGRIFSAVFARDAEGMDKTRAAFDAFFANNPAAMGAIISTAVPDSRNDLLARITDMTRK